jgi:hypothetical protein
MKGGKYFCCGGPPIGCDDGWAVAEKEKEDREFLRFFVTNCPHNLMFRILIG